MHLSPPVDAIPAEVIASQVSPLVSSEPDLQIDDPGSEEPGSEDSGSDDTPSQPASDEITLPGLGPNAVLVKEQESGQLSVPEADEIPDYVDDIPIPDEDPLSAVYKPTMEEEPEPEVEVEKPAPVIKGMESVFQIRENWAAIVNELANSLPLIAGHLYKTEVVIPDEDSLVVKIIFPSESVYQLIQAKKNINGILREFLNTKFTTPISFQILFDYKNQKDLTAYGENESAAPLKKLTEEELRQKDPLAKYILDLFDGHIIEGM